MIYSRIHEWYSVSKAGEITNAKINPFYYFYLVDVSFHKFIEVMESSGINNVVELIREGVQQGFKFY